jgi:hypothetical protein
MKMVTRLKVSPVVLLVLLVVLLLMVLLHKGLTPEEAERRVVDLEGSVVHDSFATVAFVALVALFAFVMWTALSANEEEDKATPPARESSASDKMAPH